MVEMKHDEDVLRGFHAPEHNRHFHCEPNKTVDVPEDVVWRAEAHGFTKVKVKKAVEKTPVVSKPPEVEKPSEVVKPPEVEKTAKVEAPVEEKTAPKTRKARKRK